MIDGTGEFWWKNSKESLWQTLFGVVRFLKQNQSYRSTQNAYNLRMYGNLNTMGLNSYSFSQNPAFSYLDNKVTFNIVQSMCDTVTQKMAKNKPKPTFLTIGGDWGLQQRAKKSNKFIEGQFYENKIYEKGPKIFLDSTVFGTGAMHIFREGTKIKTERVFIEELIVDDAEAIYGTPRNLYRTKFVSRDVMAAMFPEFKTQIMMAKNSSEVFPTHRSLSRNIEVIEAWHLPANKDSNDGVHAIIIDGATLDRTEYKRQYFPFAWQRWGDRLLGFYGQGLAEQLMGNQIELNKALGIVEQCFNYCTPALLVEMGSKVNPDHMNNEIARIAEYSGTPPTWYAPNPVPDQIFKWIEMIFQKSYQIAGISEMAAMSMKPAGLTSGKSLRVFNEIESQRFMLTGQNYENFYLEIAKQMMDLGKEIYEEDKDFSVKYKDKGFIQEIKWEDINLEEDKYVLQMFPTSMLADTPSGKLADIQEYLQSGFIDQRYALKLLDFPDLEAYTRLANASIDDIEKQISYMLEEGEYFPPEPYQDLALGIKTMQSAYLWAKTQNAPEERLELLRRWIEQAKLMIDNAQAAQMAQQQAAMAAAQGPQVPGAIPLGRPEKPPVSDMIPFGGGQVPQGVPA